MVSTRLAHPRIVSGLADPRRRNRVDPGKLLDLIDRIKNSGHAGTQHLPGPRMKPLAKTG